MRRARQEGGFALLIVLLTLAFLALIIARALADARADMTRAHVALVRAQDDASLYAATQTALFHLQARGEQRWPSEGTHRLGADTAGSIVIRTHALDTLIPLNTAGPTVLAGLFQACRVPADAAVILAQHIVAYRNAGGQAAVGGSSDLAFGDASELIRVQGMTPEIIACARPHLSAFQRDMPRPDTPDRMVAQALRLSTQMAPGDTPAPEDLPSMHGAAPNNPTSPNFTPIGGSAEPVIRIDLNLVRGEARRYRTIIASLVDPNGSVPYRILAVSDSTTNTLQ